MNVWDTFCTDIIGAVTLTMVNAISHGKLSRGGSHLSFSIPR